MSAKIQPNTVLPNGGPVSLSIAYEGPFPRSSQLHEFRAVVTVDRDRFDRETATAGHERVTYQYGSEHSPWLAESVPPHRWRETTAPDGRKLDHYEIGIVARDGTRLAFDVESAGNRYFGQAFGEDAWLRVPS